VVATYGEIVAHAQAEERFIRRGPIGVMAYHGGTLELLTDTIAAAVAERTGSSYYGLVQSLDPPAHFPSISVDPALSTALAAFVEHVDVAITIHGFGRPTMMSALLLGGTNRALAEHLAGPLRSALPAYDVVTDLEVIPRPLRGMHRRNPVNLPRRGGVQIELPPRVRGMSPLWWDWEGEGLTPHTEALVDGLARGIRSWR
jgi:phage replication-related protein YjqB (UPF0714/DUF867 family)